MGVDITVQKHHFPECADCFTAKILAGEFVKKLEKNAHPLEVLSAEISFNCTMSNPITSIVKTRVSGKGEDLGGQIKEVEYYDKHVFCPGWVASIKRREESQNQNGNWNH